MLVDTSYVVEFFFLNNNAESLTKHVFKKSRVIFLICLALDN